MDVRPLASDASLSIADGAFRRGVLVLRWGLLLTYLIFVAVGVLDVSAAALALTTLVLLAYDLALTFVEARYQGGDERVFAVTRLIDIASITLVLVSLHDVGNPVWAVYFISMVGVAHLLTPREMAWHVLWIAANYVVFAFATLALGHDVSWPYVVTVTVLLFFMGFNASLIAGGEQRLRDLIARIAVTDSLTGLPNRRHFHDAYPANVSESIQRNVPLALMLIDVDRFKEINDRDGHPAGDDKLREVARALQLAMRREDIVARYGGDEFIVVAPHTARSDARALAERLRIAAIGCHASVSIGLAMFPDDAADEDALVTSADAALYRAKQAGRNCVRYAA